MVSNERILLVDDEPGVLSAIQHILEIEAYEVSTASTAEEGLKKAEAIQPHLIVLDLKMPGMSGLRFLNEITGPDGKRQYPVLILTAYANMSTFFENVDVDGFMLKPCKGTSLLSEVRRILDVHKRDVEDTVRRTRARVVLVAEDDEEQCKDLVRNLARVGYDVHSVDNGSDVIGKAATMLPDLVVTKEVLSQMNGHAVAGALSNIPKTAKIPVVLYDQGGYAAAFGEDELRRRGITSVVPTDRVSDIVTEVQRLLAT